MCHMYIHILSQVVHVSTNRDMLTQSLANEHASKHTLTLSLPEIYSSIKKLTYINTLATFTHTPKNAQTSIPSYNHDHKFIPT